jgi:hypothetical protein
MGLSEAAESSACWTLEGDGGGSGINGNDTINDGLKEYSHVSPSNAGLNIQLSGRGSVRTVKGSEMWRFLQVHGRKDKTLKI